MKTRDRILEAARLLFNAEGLALVSANRIAAELEISPGNLHYHFRRKEDLVEALFRRFTESLRSLSDAHLTVEALDDLWLTLHLAFEAIDHYRFIYRDIDYLVREYPALHERARALTERRIEAMQRICEKLVARGVVDATPAQISALSFQIVLTTTCWYSFERLAAPPAQQGASSGAAAYQVLTLLAPYVNHDAGHYLDYLRSKYVPPSSLRSLPPGGAAR